MAVDFPAPARVVPVTIGKGANRLALRFGRGRSATPGPGPGWRRVVGRGRKLGTGIKWGGESAWRPLPDGDRLWGRRGRFGHPVTRRSPITSPVAACGRWRRGRDSNPRWL